jgi:purine-binding chemotaxis protein CheW
MPHAPPEELRSDEAPEVPTESLLVVRAGRRLFALPLAAVQEVVPELPLTPIPGSGAAVVGMVNVRGRVVPVLDLAIALGAGEEGAADRRLLVVERVGGAAALRVEDVVRIERVPRDELDGVVGGGEGEWVRGELALEIGGVDLLDAERLLERELG